MNVSHSTGRRPIHCQKNCSCSSSSLLSPLCSSLSILQHPLSLISSLLARGWWGSRVPTSWWQSARQQDHGVCSLFSLIRLFVQQEEAHHDVHPRRRTRRQRAGRRWRHKMSVHTGGSPHSMALALRMKSEVRAKGPRSTEQVHTKQALSVELRTKQALEAPSRTAPRKPSLLSSVPSRPLRRRGGPHRGSPLCWALCQAGPCSSKPSSSSLPTGRWPPLSRFPSGDGPTATAPRCRVWIWAWRAEIWAQCFFIFKKSIFVVGPINQPIL
jgi:hypothetical protein